MLWIIPKIEEMFDRFLKRKLKVPYILQINKIRIDFIEDKGA